MGGAKKKKKVDDVEELYAVSSISNYIRKMCQISCQEIKRCALLWARQIFWRYGFIRDLFCFLELSFSLFTFYFAICLFLMKHKEMYLYAPIVHYSK